jgi:hypothetical protein
MPRARGRLLVPVGPPNSNHSLQGTVLILSEPFLGAGGRMFGLSELRGHFNSTPKSEGPL